MGGVRLTDPLEQRCWTTHKSSSCRSTTCGKMTPAVLAQLDRLSRLTDKIYIHIDMDVLDPREVMAHGNKVPERTVERGARGAVRADLPPLSEGLGDRLRHDSADG